MFSRVRHPLITIGRRECRPQAVFGVKAKVPVHVDRSSVSGGPKMDSCAIERARFVFSTKMAMSLARSRAQRPLVSRSRLNRCFSRVSPRVEITTATRVDGDLNVPRALYPDLFNERRRVSPLSINANLNLSLSTLRLGSDRGCRSGSKLMRR